MNILKIQIADSPDKAPNYRDSGWVGADLFKAVVVARGMEGGDPSVDLQLRLADGRRVVAMVSGRVLESLAGAIEATRKRTNTN